MSSLKPEDAAIPHRTQSSTDQSPPYDAPTRLSRSPHPYAGSRRLHKSSSYLPSPALTPHQSDTERPVISRSVTPAESGTEADDETIQPRALPPPPLRPRKGLRDERGEGYIEPELDPPSTPPQAQDSTKILKRQGIQLSLDGSAKSVEAERKDKHGKRRNAELRRRGAEALSLACISYLCLKSFILKQQANTERAGNNILETLEDVHLHQS